jgi:hypothetical protein
MSSTLLLSQVQPQITAGLSAEMSLVRRPLSWLAVIVGLGLVLRCGHLNSSLQLDEFGPLYAIAERQTTSPGQLPYSSDPLVPVTSWQQVRSRSVLPYGVVYPVPLYHYLLYGLIQVLPICELSLRLPSLLAGLGCILALYGLCRRILGTEIALVAALLAAIDPIQIGVSVIARPYALANLLCVLSFVLLMQIFSRKRRSVAFLAAVGYAIVIAGIGYLNPALLLIVSAHAVWVIWWLIARVSRECYKQDPGIAFGWLGLYGASCALAGLLLVPEFVYTAQVSRFARDHHAHLVAALVYSQLPLLAFLLHNSTLLVVLNVVVVGRRLYGPSQWGQDSGPLRKPDRGSLWLGIIWLVVPQLLALALAYGTGQAIFLSRYLSYTSLGGAMVVAWCVAQIPLMKWRLRVTAALAVTTCLWSVTEISRGVGLSFAGTYRTAVSRMKQLEHENRFEPGDLVLFRPGFLEADLFPKELPADTREAMAGVLAAPLRTLYAVPTAKPYVCLSLSQYLSSEVRTHAGHYFAANEFYDAAFADKLRSYDRFWYCDDEGDSNAFLACFLPWLASVLAQDLSVEDPFQEPPKRFLVPAQGNRGELAGILMDEIRADPPRILLIERTQSGRRNSGSAKVEK